MCCKLIQADILLCRVRTLLFMVLKRALNFCPQSRYLIKNWQIRCLLAIVSLDILIAIATKQMNHSNQGEMVEVGELWLERIDRNYQAESLYIILFCCFARGLSAGITKQWSVLSRMQDQCRYQKPRWGYLGASWPVWNPIVLALNNFVFPQGGWSRH